MNIRRMNCNHFRNVAFRNTAYVQLPAVSYNIHTDGLSSTETSLLNFRPILQPLPGHVHLLSHSHSKLNISQAEFTLYPQTCHSFPTPSANAWQASFFYHHSSQVPEQQSQMCCLLLLHPISNQVTPTQVPSTSPVPSSPLPLHLVCITSSVDCTLISFILPQTGGSEDFIEPSLKTGLCVTCPSHVLNCFLASPKVNYWHMWIIFCGCTLSLVLRQIGFDVRFIYS